MPEGPASDVYGARYASWLPKYLRYCFRIPLKKDGTRILGVSLLALREPKRVLGKCHIDRGRKARAEEFQDNGGELFPPFVRGKA